TIRYPGHCEIIKGMINIGLASEKQILGKIKPRELFTYLLKKYLKSCKDVVLLRVSVVGKKEKIEYELVDYFDEKNRMSAMQRTTGYPASIIAQMMVNDEIKKGVTPPELCVPGEKFLSELSKRKIRIEKRF
ncbi:MAG: saccharopine dehydrogenase, partial [Candidatus Thermoplasmatota archaeon]|nr:saccharopine dehydrogenase [Candidatus Thermoplasmatota archaeon]